MGNCWSEREHNTQITYKNLTPADDVGVKKNIAPVPAPPLTRVLPREEKEVATASHGGGGVAQPVQRVPPPRPVVGRIIRPQLKMFGYSELKNATKNFRPDSVVGEGGFGRVYKGWLDESTLAPSKAGVGIPVAVKRCNANSAQGFKEWNAEIEYLGKFCHPNLVKLIGYCWEDKELLLVYEYVQKGSLENHLFPKNVEPPNWSTRIRIAMDAARGLDFLHTSENTVIYRDFKAANILLDENYVAKLSDFGLARRGPPVDRSHVTTQAVGTYGYAAPEYVNTGHLYVTSDVYGFGVVLLELLTGLRAFDVGRPTGQTSLVDGYKSMLENKSKIKKIIDHRMEDYPSGGPNQLGQIILKCLANDPKKRPPMSEVLADLERLSTIKSNTKNPRHTSSKSLTQKKPNKAHSYHPSPLHHQHRSPMAPPRRPTPHTRP